MHCRASLPTEADPQTSPQRETPASSLLPAASWEGAGDPTIPGTKARQSWPRVWWGVPGKHRPSPLKFAPFTFAENPQPEDQGSRRQIIAAATSNCRLGGQYSQICPGLSGHGSPWPWSTQAGAPGCPGRYEMRLMGYSICLLFRAESVQHAAKQRTPMQHPNPDFSGAMLVGRSPSRAI